MSCRNQKEQKMSAARALPSSNFIGPVMPEDMKVKTENPTIEKEKQDQATKAAKSQKRTRRSYSSYPENLRDDQYRQRSGSHDNKTYRKDRDRSNRRNIAKKSKRDDYNYSPDNRTYRPHSGKPRMHMGVPHMADLQMSVPLMGEQPGYMGNMNMMPGMTQIMPYSMMNNVIAPQRDHSMPGMHMSHMIPNIMNENKVINQNIYEPISISCGIMLPPIPGATTPQVRKKPSGCRTIFVGGLPKLNVEVLHEMFHNFGIIENISSPKPGLYYIRFENPSSVDKSFMLTGFRFKFHEQTEKEATTMFVDYVTNCDDQKHYIEETQREEIPSCVEPFSTAALCMLSEKIKTESEFIAATQTLAIWMQRGECDKLNANTFYSLIQSCNSQARRLFNEKMQIADNYQNMKNTYKDRFARVVVQ